MINKLVVIGQGWRNTQIKRKPSSKLYKAIMSFVG